MKKILVGFILSTLIIGSVLVSGTTVNNNLSDKIKFEFEDGKITSTLSIGDYEIQMEKKSQ